MPKKKDPHDDSIAALVVIIRACHLTRDWVMKRIASKKLEDRYGMRIVFTRKKGDT